LLLSRADWPVQLEFIPGLYIIPRHVRIGAFPLWLIISAIPGCMIVQCGRGFGLVAVD
jgi:hypothetical protein